MFAAGAVWRRGCGQAEVAMRGQLAGRGWSVVGGWLWALEADGFGVGLGGRISRTGRELRRRRGKRGHR